MIDQLNFEKMDGLIPVVIQHHETSAVLMVGFMNQEALKRTLQDRRVTFWSRTRNRLWQKGESSGHFLNVISIEADCDGDTLLIQALPEGPVCHTGADACFSFKPHVSELHELEKIIQDRKERMPAESYTAKLFGKGILKIGQKVGEEAIELALAAQYPDQSRCVQETADLIYHILVLLASRDLTLAQIEEELHLRRKS